MYYSYTDNASYQLTRNKFQKEISLFYAILKEKSFEWKL